MPLKLMYITNRPEVAVIAQNTGVDRIFLDMEYIGKDERQAGMNTVKSHHSVADIRLLRPLLTSSELLVRINPLQPADSGFDSRREIREAIDAGADILMLPMYRTAEEAARFADMVGGRAKTMLLVETAEAMRCLPQTLAGGGIDMIHIGLNDLHLSLKKKFMFELLADGTVDAICAQVRAAGLPYGFGGIARLGYGMLPAESVIAEHYRLGSQAAILSRSFCNANQITDTGEMRELFDTEMRRIRAFEREAAGYTPEQFARNRQYVRQAVAQIVAGLPAEKKAE